MTRSGIDTPVARLLLALDAASHDPASVESAVALAARLQIELLGLFVEDADLLRVARRLQLVLLDRIVRRTLLPAVAGCGSPADEAKASGSKLELAAILFSGLLVFNLFAECVNRSPQLMLENANYVKRVVFPLGILPVVVMGYALFHAAMSIAVLSVFMILALGSLPWTVVLLPLIFLPLVLLVLGVAVTLLPAVGVFDSRAAWVEQLPPWVGAPVLAALILAIVVARSVLGIEDSGAISQVMSPMTSIFQEKVSCFTSAESGRVHLTGPL